MMDFWPRLEGAVLNGTYVLRQRLESDGGGALFLTEVEGRKAAVRLALADERQLSCWRRAEALSHPGLVHVFETGAAELEATPVTFAVTEYPDEGLDGVLRERALTEAEAREALDATIKALACLHGKGVVHGKVEPANILAVGDAIKLSTNALSPAGEDRPWPRRPYDPPEDALSPASDVWSLGVTLFEVLTRKRPNGAQDPEQLPQPFREIVRGALEKNPEDRWSVAEIASYLNTGKAPARAIAASRAPVDSPEEAPIPDAPERGRRVPMWVYAAVVLGVVLLLVLFARSPREEQTEAAPAAVEKKAPATPRPSPMAPEQAAPRRAEPPPRAEAPERTAAAQPEGEPAPEPARSARADGPAWRVIVYTYRNARDAERRAKLINSRWPDFQAEVFSPKGEGGPRLVAIGGRMDREEAARLQQKARSAGLPRDAYIQNYSN